MKKFIYLVLIILTSISCSNNDKAVKQLTEEKIESMNGHEVIRDLLIENEGDKEQLARIMKCSVPTINRVLNKKTYLTENAIKEFRNLLRTVEIKGKDTFIDTDPYYNSWIRSFNLWLNKWKYYALGLCLLGFMMDYAFNASTASLDTLIMSNAYESDNSSFNLGKITAILIVIFFGVGYLITWIGNMIWSYEQTNLFIEKINPIFETLM